MNGTAIVIGCHCGWMGIASTMAQATEVYLDHTFTAGSREFHEDLMPIAIAIPFNSLSVERLTKEMAAQVRLARWREYRRDAQANVEAEARLRGWALIVLMTLAAAGLALAFWRWF